MQRLLLIITLLFLAGCRGSGGDGTAQLDPSAGSSEPAPGLHLSWVASGAGVEVTLSAVQAADLYQAAAVVTFPEDKYEIGAVSAGGGLGSEAETFFAAGVTAPGRLEFGYTKRYVGPGEYGDVRLLQFSVSEATDFRIADIAVDYVDAPPLLRDSQRREIALPAGGGAR